MGRLARADKGRVRVIGGLGASEPSCAFLGALGPPSGASVGAPARECRTETFKCHSDCLKAARGAARGQSHVLSATGRAREIREEMVLHVSQGTICPKADDLMSEARDILHALEGLHAEGCSMKEALEQKYFDGDGVAAETGADLGH